MAGVGRADDMFFRLDADRDGVLDLEEYLAGAAMTEELFDMADVDASGAITERELEYMRYIADGYDGSGLLAEMDADGDGVVERGEFARSITARAATQDWEHRLDLPYVARWVEEAYERADVDRDGILNMEELLYAIFLVDRALVTEGGLEDRGVLASRLFEELDADHDRRIGAHEVARGLAREAEWGGPRSGHRSIVRRIGEYFAEADLDGDDSLDAAETEELAGRILAELRDEL